MASLQEFKAIINKLQTDFAPPVNTTEKMLDKIANSKIEFPVVVQSLAVQEKA